MVSAFFEKRGISMDSERVLRIYWQQYKLPEKRMLELSEYVMVTQKNFPVFSAQFIQMFLTICSEIDSVADKFCSLLGIVASKDKYGIMKKINIIVDKYKNLRDWKCDTKSPFDVLHLVPFKKFDGEQSADWWTAYNKVKHFRTDIDDNGVYNYERANLKNVIYSLSALYMLLYKMKTEFYADVKINTDSEIFDIDRSNLK